MFINEEILVKRATRLMNQDVSVDTRSIKPDTKKRYYFNPTAPNANGIIWYDEARPLWFADELHKVYVGELRMVCDGFPDKHTKAFKGWLWTFGICADGTLECWSN